MLSLSTGISGFPELRWFFSSVINVPHGLTCLLISSISLSPFQSVSAAQERKYLCVITIFISFLSVSS